MPHNTTMMQKTFTIIETTQKTSDIIKEMKALFPVWSYLDDKKLDTQFPPPKEITTREFLYSVEPDPDTLGKSAKEADPQQTGITLRERMLLEIQYFEDTGSHLDVKGWTICSGSRDSDGRVPFVYFDPYTDEVEVSWYDVDDSGSTYGLRQQVPSLPSPSYPSDLESRLKNVEEFMRDNFKGFTI